MKLRIRLLLLLVAGMLFAQTAPQYHVLKRATIGGEGGWDYLTVDSAARRLYITRGTHVMVVDAESLKVAGDIPNTAGVHGVALVPEINQGFTSNGSANTVTAFDLKTLQATTTIPVGERPDAIIYDPVSGRVFTFNARSHDATALDAKAGKAAGTLALGGKPEFAVPDGAGHMYVNIEDTAEVVMFDTRKLAVLQRWPLKGCEEPTGLALDAKHKRLFSVCQNQMMAIVNADSGARVTSVPIGAGVDGVVFDADSGMAFSSNGGSGTITVVREDSPDKFSVVETVETARGARTIALDPKSHKLYTIAAKFEPVAAGERPKMMAGTFEVIVVGK